MTGLAPVARPVTLNGTGTLSPFGSAAVSFTGSQDQRTRLTEGAFTFLLNRLDSFNVTATPQIVGKVTNLSVSGPITGGTGAFSGATGSIAYTFTFTANTSSAGTFTLTGSGSITVGQTTTPITLSAFSGTASVINAASGAFQLSPTGSVAPFGNAMVNFSGIAHQSGAIGPTQGTLTFVFNANDSFSASFSSVLDLNSPSVNLACTVGGGSGIFNGVTGTLTANFALSQDESMFTLTGSGTITQPPASTLAITSVSTVYGAPAIAQNTYIQINGTKLAPANTPAAGANWNTAASFASGTMPTQLGNMSVTVNSKPAFVYFYCSAATDSSCAQDQLNILTPLDTTIGPIQVVVTNGAASKPPFTANLQANSPSFLLFSAKGYVVATHLDYSLLGPAGLYTTSTPAKPGEPVILYAVGFGLPATPLTNGASTQAGSLPVFPVCQVGGTPAAVSFAGLIEPGLFQLNLTIPSTAANGDNQIGCTYNGSSTPAGNLITVQR